MRVQIVLASTPQSETLHVIPYLEQHNWLVTTAITGATALALVEKIRPVAALVDVRLPDMTGWDVLQQIRESPPLRTTVVLLVYPKGATDDDFFRGHWLGADVNLPAPDPQGIVAFISRLLMPLPEA